MGSAQGGNISAQEYIDKIKVIRKVSLTDCLAKEKSANRLSIGANGIRLSGSP